MFSLANWGHELAEAYRDRLRRVLDELLDRPGRGTPVSGKAQLRSVKAERHRIYYSAGERSLRVVRILHHSRDAARHLP